MLLWYSKCEEETSKSKTFTHLDLADENGLKSIAFCCTSTGVFMFPNQRAAEIAVQTVKEYTDKDNEITNVSVFYRDLDNL